ncbi:spexin isoform X1 [Amblyraja radiata]|uniref:spexin isoform X1 n=1 Tax=Amblyraja radiata TaxID=386614 RepID=UPI001402765D|nr:spexin isoform X1 [Amblyraja radiata]
MKGLGTVTVQGLLLFFVSSYLVQSRDVPQGHFQRRNWTPQAILYLKGAQGRRFIADDGKDSDLFEKIDIETRSQNTNPSSLSEAMAVLLASVRQAQEGKYVGKRSTSSLHSEMRMRKVNSSMSEKRIQTGEKHSKYLDFCRVSLVEPLD